jgi:hypothetical protein
MPITTQFTWDTPFRVSHKTFGLHNIYFGIWGAYCIALAKHRRKEVPTSFCNDIVNHETNKCFLNFYSMFTISCQIVIQVNEGIAKKFTLMVEGDLNEVIEFKCNICIILGYLHSP